MKALKGDLQAKRWVASKHALQSARNPTERTPPDPLRTRGCRPGAPGGPRLRDPGSGRDLGLRAPNSRFVSALAAGALGLPWQGCGSPPPTWATAPRAGQRPANARGGPGPPGRDGGLRSPRPRVPTGAHSARPASPWSGVCSVYSWHSVEPAFPTPILPVPSCPGSGCRGEQPGCGSPAGAAKADSPPAVAVAGL